MHFNNFTPPPHVLLLFLQLHHDFLFYTRSEKEKMKEKKRRQSGPALDGEVKKSEQCRFLCQWAGERGRETLFSVTFHQETYEYHWSTRLPGHFIELTQILCKYIWTSFDTFTAVTFVLSLVFLHIHSFLIQQCVCVSVCVCEGVSVGNGLAFAVAWVEPVSVPPQQNCSFLHSGGNNPHSPTPAAPITARSSIFSCNGTYCYLAGLVESSDPVSHVGHIIGLQEVPSRKCIDNCRRRNQFCKYPHWVQWTILSHMGDYVIVNHFISVTLFLPKKLTKAELCLGLLLRCSFTHLRIEEEKRNVNINWKEWKKQRNRRFTFLT